MVSYSVYKLVHLVGIFALFLAFGASLASEKGKFRWISPLHGIALLLILIAGFGMLARLGIMSELPTWAVGKLVVWLLLGLALVLAKRKLLPFPIVITLLLLLGGTATYLAIWKP